MMLLIPGQKLLSGKITGFNPGDRVENSPGSKKYSGSATVSFVWLFGMDASADQQEFLLRADGRELIRFSNPVQAELNEVEFSGKENSSLAFRTTKIDRHKDAKGYAILTLPAAAVTPGKAVQLQVSGSNSGSNIWYMTFQLPVEERIYPSTATCDGKGW
jgi:hypothetical protein